MTKIVHDDVLMLWPSDRTCGYCSEALCTNSYTGSESGEENQHTHPFHTSGGDRCDKCSGELRDHGLVGVTHASEGLLVCWCGDFLHYIDCKRRCEDPDSDPKQSCVIRFIAEFGELDGA